MLLLKGTPGWRPGEGGGGVWEWVSGGLTEGITLLTLSGASSWTQCPQRGSTCIWNLPSYEQEKRINQWNRKKSVPKHLVFLNSRYFQRLTQKIQKEGDGGGEKKISESATLLHTRNTTVTTYPTYPAFGQWSDPCPDDQLLEKKMFKL